MKTITLTALGLIALVGAPPALAQQTQQPPPQYQPQQQYPQQQYPNQQYPNQVYPQQQYPQQQYPQQQPGYGYGQPAPAPQPRTEHRPIVGLAVSGGVMLGVSWLIHGALISPLAGYSVSSGFQPGWEAFRLVGLVPIAGPWIQLALHPHGFGNDGWPQYLVVDGVLQAAGLTMLILGLALKEEVTVYGELDGPGPSLAVLPTTGEHGGGISAVGRF